jgi:hypothetical protein
LGFFCGDLGRGLPKYRPVLPPTGEDTFKGLYVGTVPRLGDLILSAEDLLWTGSEILFFLFPPPSAAAAAARAFFRSVDDLVIAALVVVVAVVSAAAEAVVVVFDVVIVLAVALDEEVGAETLDLAGLGGTTIYFSTELDGNSTGLFDKSPVFDLDGDAVTFMADENNDGMPVLQSTLLLDLTTLRFRFGDPDDADNDDAKVEVVALLGEIIDVDTAGTNASSSSSTFCVIGGGLLIGVGGLDRLAE